MEASLLQVAFLLIAVHFVLDYPLQGDFLARAKAEGPLRVWHLFGHSVIHGAGVMLVTGSIGLGVAETVVHAAIDEAKVRGWTTFAHDQALHMVCKIVWLTVWAIGFGGVPG